MIVKNIKMNQVKLVIGSLSTDIDKSIYESLKYCAEKIMIRHFQFGKQSAYHFPKLSPKYAARKLKKYGKQPILVASGELKQKVITDYKIIKSGKILKLTFDVPNYGKYVIEGGRDWRVLVERDRKDIARFRWNTFYKLRKNFAARL